MSEDTQNPAPKETPSMGSLFLGVLADEADATPEPSDPVEPPAPTDAQAPEAGDPTTTPDGQPAGEVPLWSGQEEAGRSFAEKIREANEAKEAARKAEEAARAKEAEAAYWRGLAEGRGPVAQAKVETKDEDPEPDPEKFQDDAAYYAAVRAWDRRQAAKEVRAELLPEVQALKEHAAEQAWAASMARAEATAGSEWDAIAAYANHMQKVSPGFAHDLLRAPDPGRFVLDTYRLARGQAPAAAVTPATPKAPTPAPASAAGAPTLEALLADPAQRASVLRILAAEKAAQGVIPQVPTGPLGVGSGPGAQGAADGITVESIRAMNNPQKLEETRAKVFGAWIADGQTG